MANKNKKYKRSIEDAGRISDEDKSTSYITTGGAGYIPNNYGQGTIDYIRKKLYDNVPIDTAHSSKKLLCQQHTDILFLDG